MYTGNIRSNTISVVDTSNNTESKIIPVGDYPRSIEHNPFNNYMYVVNSNSDTVSVIGTPISKPQIPTADAGPNQSVNSKDIVQLDSSNSSDPNDSRLSYFWNQTSGPEVALSNTDSPNPTFTAPEVNDQTNLTFQLTVTNQEGASEHDEVIITINPISQPPSEEPRTIGGLIKGIIKNPLDVTNSIDSANQIRDMLTDNDPDNDELVCDLIDPENELTSNIRQILDC